MCMVVNEGVQCWGKGKFSNLCVTLECQLGPANAFLTCFSVNENIMSMDCFIARFFFFFVPEIRIL